jgi:hypothetical protein
MVTCALPSPDIPKHLLVGLEQTGTLEASGDAGTVRVQVKVTDAAA